MRRTNPMDAYQKARMQVLNLLSQCEHGSWTWQNLWKMAKKNGLIYNTFRKHMTELMREGIVTVRTQGDMVPAKVTYLFDKDKLKLEILYLEDILAFINKKVKEGLVSLDDSGWFAITDNDDFQTLFKQDKIQDHEKPEECFRDFLELNALIARIGLLLSKRKEQITLAKYPLEKQTTLAKYEEALFEYVDLHLGESLFQGLKKEEDKRDVKIIFTPDSFEDALKELSFFRNSGQRSMRSRWSEAQLNRKQKLEQFFREHESDYKDLKEKLQLSMKEKTAIIIPAFGFRGGYPEKRNTLLRSLPPEIALPFLHERKELSEKDLEGMRESLENTIQKTGEHKTVFVCPSCFEGFKRERGCSEHIKRKHSKERIFPLRMSINYYKRTRDVVRDLMQKS